jgi:3-oxoadipate CoA-transferase, alpha subunit
VTIVQARELLDAGAIDPEIVITPGIFVNRIVVVADPVQELQLVNEGRSYP